jgi:hypothetical protein
MTGSDLLTQFDAIVANDFAPIGASTTAGKLSLLNIAARKVMRNLAILEQSVQFNFISGTTRYDLYTLSTPLYEVLRVRNGSSTLVKDPDPDNLGWYPIDHYIDVYANLPDATVLKLTGYRGAPQIANTNTQITLIPEEALLPVVQLAVVEGCVANEDTNEQRLRLASLEKTAYEKLNRYRSMYAKSQFPDFSNRRGVIYPRYI